ncbi:hypothetical protein AMTR_s00181p00045630 [Amborella trichopoda]|uniref:DUF7963 domain-containing protein n=1 Tax=Amborella trichopoda TaxID=13333 RepID=W1P7T6_AMBTC|nr:hypothetical protein AMTR_s00181p00045630 [Amborella trichopoda]
MASTPGFEDDVSAKGVLKHFEGSTIVHSKAIKGKGTWYWAHLEPILVQTRTLRKHFGTVYMQFNGGVVQRCVGIVTDRFKAKALRNLESENHWMVNLSCQFQGFNSLIKDFGKQLPLFRKNPLAREVEDIIGDMGFWNELEAVLSLTKSAKTMAQEIETNGISRSPSSPLVVFRRAGDRRSVV